MAAEVKTGSARFESQGAASLKKKFAARCKKLGVSQRQRIRDLIQQDIKESKS